MVLDLSSLAESSLRAFFGRGRRKLLAPGDHRPDFRGHARRGRRLVGAKERRECVDVGHVEGRFAEDAARAWWSDELDGGHLLVLVVVAVVVAVIVAVLGGCRLAGRDEVPLKCDGVDRVLLKRSFVNVGRVGVVVAPHRDVVRGARARGRIGRQCRRDAGRGAKRREFRVPAEHVQEIARELNADVPADQQWNGARRRRAGRTGAVTVDDEKAVDDAALV